MENNLESKEEPLFNEAEQSVIALAKAIIDRDWNDSMSKHGDWHNEKFIRGFIEEQRDRNFSEIREDSISAILTTIIGETSDIKPVEEIKGDDSLQGPSRKITDEILASVEIAIKNDKPIEEAA